jgi:type IV secretory pathway VirB10-like protein
MYVTSREVKNTKYVANFHTKDAATEYENFLKNLLGVEKELVGVTRVRNSVVYTMECFKKGHTLAKQFEDDYIARMTPKVEPTPAPIPEPEPIPVPVAVQPEPIPEIIPEVVELLVEEVAEPVAEILEDITEEELTQAVEEFTEKPFASEDSKQSGDGPITSKITGFFKGSNKINTN